MEEVYFVQKIKVFKINHGVRKIYKKKQDLEHRFPDTDNLVWICSVEIKTLRHFFLHYPNFMDQIQIFLHNLEGIKKTILNKHVDCKLHVPIYDTLFRHLQQASAYLMHLLNTL